MPESDKVCSTDSAPRGLAAVTALLAGKLKLDQIPPQSIETTGSNKMCAVFFRDWNVIQHAFVINQPPARNVYPSLILRRSGQEWQLEPFIFDDGGRECVTIPISDQWLRVLLDLVTSELDPLLPDPSTIYTRKLTETADGWCEDNPPIQHALLKIQDFHGGYQRFFDTAQNRKWFIARRWPVWMANGYSQDEAASEVAKEEGLNAYSSGTLRAMLKTMGLIWSPKSK